ARPTRSTRSAYSGPITRSRRLLSSRASAGLRPPVDTAIWRSPRRSTDGAMKSHWAGRSTTFTSAAAAPALGGDRGVHVGHARRGDHERRVAHVDPPERARPVDDAPGRGKHREVPRDRRADDGHRGAALEEIANLARGHSAAADDESEPAAEVEKHREV